jgi:hypothetical protein
MRGARHRGRVNVQIVAFPQSGVMRWPGVLDLLDAAVREGADLVGGIDPLEIDRDPKGQLDGVFAIAGRERHPLYDRGQRRPGGGRRPSAAQIGIVRRAHRRPRGCRIAGAGADHLNCSFACREKELWIARRRRCR